MAYRRRQQVGRVSIVEEDIGSSFNPQTPPPPYDVDDVSSPPSASSLAAKAIRASSAHRDSSLSSAYGQSVLSSPRESVPAGSASPSSSKGPSNYAYTSMKSLNEPKQGFWGALARKAKSIIDEDNVSPQNDNTGKTRFPRAASSQYDRTYQSSEGHPKIENPKLQRGPKIENPKLQRGLGAIASSLNYIGGTIGNALEEGLTVVENRTADIIQETRKLQIRKKGSNMGSQNQTDFSGALQQPTSRTHGQPQVQADLEIQLKASRDVAMAMAAKAKLLLRELKTVKADLAFAKERCAQLEEENRILRESREKGDNPEDDDLIRLQLETLLAEKARLAQENSVFARENRFLREIVEYHQLTMQDVVYLDEGNEEVTEVYPIKVPSASNLQSLGTPTSLSLSSPSPKSPYSVHPEVNQGDSLHTLASSDPKDSRSITSLSSYNDMTEDRGKQ